MSKRHGEVVCVAGIRTDTPTPEWCRLFPVPFRDLPFSAQFRKYQRIRLEVERPGSDRRPESYKPLVNTLECVGEPLDSKKKWGKRRPLVEPLVVESMCEILRRQKVDRTSLGVFRPADVEDFTIEPDTAEWDAERQFIVDQPSLLYEGRSGLEKIPYRFKYHYRCSDPDCRGHHQSIVDWELAQAMRSWRWKYRRDDVLLAKIRELWFERMCGEDKDTMLFVGNQHQAPDAFLVLGVFWPPKD